MTDNANQVPKLPPVVLEAIANSRKDMPNVHNCVTVVIRREDRYDVVSDYLPPLEEMLGNPGCPISGDNTSDEEVLSCLTELAEGVSLNFANGKPGGSEQIAVVLMAHLYAKRKSTQIGAPDISYIDLDSRRLFHYVTTPPTNSMVH